MEAGRSNKCLRSMDLLTRSRSDAGEGTHICFCMENRSSKSEGHVIDLSPPPPPSTTKFLHAKTSSARRHQRPEDMAHLLDEQDQILTGWIRAIVSVTLTRRIHIAGFGCDRVEPWPDGFLRSGATSQHPVRSKCIAGGGTDVFDRVLVPTTESYTRSRINRCQ